MELEKTALPTCETVFCETREHGLECEIVLPDYYPEIEKILSCALTPTTESVTAGGDAVVAAGCAEIRVAYRTAGPGAVTFDTAVKYSKRIACPPTQEGDLCLARQTAASVQARAVGPRKIEVRATVAIRAEICRRGEIEAASAARETGLQTLCAKESVFRLQGMSVAELSFRHAVAVPFPRAEIAAVLSGAAALNVQETRAVANKAMLKGTLSLSMTLVSAAGESRPDLRYDLPFTEIREVYGLKDDAAISVCVLEQSFTADPKTEVGERELEVTARFRVLIAGGVNAGAVRLEDAFSCAGEAKLERARAAVPLRAGTFAAGVPFTCTAQPESREATFVCAEASSAAASVREENGACVLSLRANAVFYFEDREGRLAAVQRTVSAEAPAEGLPPGATPYLSAAVRELRCDAAGGSGTFTVSGFWMEPAAFEFITDIKVEPAPKRPEKLLLYYAGAGERLWEIAKAYKTPPEEIRGADCGPEERIKEDRLLTFYASR